MVPVTLTTMNYACVVFAGGLTFSGIWVAVRGRTHYHGPPTPVNRASFS